MATDDLDRLRNVAAEILPTALFEVDGAIVTDIARRQTLLADTTAGRWSDVVDRVPVEELISGHPAPPVRDALRLYAETEEVLKADLDRLAESPRLLLSSSWYAFERLVNTAGLALSDVLPSPVITKVRAVVEQLPLDESAVSTMTTTLEERVRHWRKA